MRPLPRFVCRMLALGASSAAVMGQPAGLPALSGEITGELRVQPASGGPEWPWRARVQPGPDGVWRVKLTIAGGAPPLSVTATMERGLDAGRWRIEETEWKLGEAWKITAPFTGRAGALPADLELSGALRLGGEGIWDGAGARGEMAARVENASARSASQAWSAEEIGIVARIEVGADGVVLRRGEITVGTAEAGGFALRGVAADVTGRAPGPLQVMRLEAEALGGRVALEAFAFDPAAPAIATTVMFSGVALSELAKLVPTALAGAQGRVDGRVAMRWTPAAGLALGKGELHVSPDASASLRLAPEPGFLTGRVPRRIALLPAWLGPVARWFSPENPAYETLSKIEQGELPLAVEALEIELYPDGPDAPRTAHVMLAASPPEGSAVKRVRFNINVAGPLDQVIRLGLSDRLQLDFGAAK